jgi:hypothetical protein
METHLGSAFQLLKQLQARLRRKGAAVGDGSEDDADTNLFRSFMPSSRHTLRNEVYSTLLNGVMREEEGNVERRQQAMRGAFAPSASFNSFPTTALDHILRRTSYDHVEGTKDPWWIALSEAAECFPPTADATSPLSPVDPLFHILSEISERSTLTLALESGSVSLRMEDSFLDQILLLLLRLSTAPSATQPVDCISHLFAGPVMVGGESPASAPLSALGDHLQRSRLAPVTLRPANHAKHSRSSLLFCKCLDLACGWLEFADSSTQAFRSLKYDLESLQTAMRMSVIPEKSTVCISNWRITDQRACRNATALIDALGSSMPVSSADFSLSSMTNLMKGLSAHETSPLVQPLLTGKATTFMWLCCLVEILTAQLWTDHHSPFEALGRTSEHLWDPWVLRWQRTLARLNLLPKPTADHIRYSAITLLRYIPTQFTKTSAFDTQREAPPVRVALLRLLEPTLDAICISVDSATLTALNMSSSSDIIQRIIFTMEHEICQLWTASNFQPLRSLWLDKKLDISLSSRESMAALVNMLLQRCRQNYHALDQSAFGLSVQPLTPFRGVDVIENICWRFLCPKSSLDEQTLIEIDSARTGNLASVTEIVSGLLRLQFKVIRAIANLQIPSGGGDKRLSWIRWSVHRVLSSLSDYLQMQLHDKTWIETKATASVDDVVSHTAAWLASIAERCFLSAQHAPINAFFERQFLLAEKLKIVFTGQGSDDEEALDKMIEHQQRNVSFLLTLLDRMIFSTGSADRYSHYVLLRLQISLSTSAMDG